MVSLVHSTPGEMDGERGFERDFHSPVPGAGVGRPRCFKSRARNHNGIDVRKLVVTQDYGATGHVGVGVAKSPQGLYYVTAIFAGH
jgi:hypothetical protein